MELKIGQRKGQTLCVQASISRALEAGVMASSSQAGDMTSSSQAGVITSSYAQQALLASYYTLTCEGGFLVVGMQAGEASGTAIRTVCTLITVSITSAWFKYRKVSRLLLFFSHWLRYVSYIYTAVLIVYIGRPDDPHSHHPPRLPSLCGLL